MAAGGGGGLGDGGQAGSVEFMVKEKHATKKYIVITYLSETK